MPADLPKRHPWGEDGRVSPDDIAPEDEEEAVGPGAPGTDVFVRALSVIPFLLIAAMGLIGLVSWVLILLFGIGSGEPVWKAVQGMSGAELLWQVLLAVLIGLGCVGATLLASWATAAGFREESGKVFWTVAQGTWGLALVGIVYLWRSEPAWLTGFQMGTTDWWFAFGVVAFAMILAGVRLRRAPRSVPR